MLEALEGSQAIARAVALCRPDVVAAYPITPQTHIVENLSRLVADGDMHTEFVSVESEFSAASVVLGAAATGARAYTATASQGVLLMSEVLFNIAGMRIPLVMTVANRAVSAPLSIWNDHSDSMAVRDSGWIHLHCADNQEATDTTIQAFRIAQETELPVMVCMDGFILTHTMEPIAMPSQDEVDGWLPPFEFSRSLDPAAPKSLGTLVSPDYFAEVRHSHHAAMIKALDVIETVDRDWANLTGRTCGGLLEVTGDPEAKVGILAMGSTVGSLESGMAHAAPEIGTARLIKLRAFRPFPVEALRAACAGLDHLIVIDRAISPGLGGVVGTEVAAVLADVPDAPRIHNHALGLGGRDIPETVFSDLMAAIADPDAPAFSIFDADMEKLAPGGPVMSQETDRADRLSELRQKFGRQPLPPGADETPHTPRETQQKFRGLDSGHRACQGCGEALAARLVMESAGPDVMIANATGCLEVFTTPWPQSAWRVPWMHSLFENAAAVASGMEAAMKAKGKNTKVLAFGGDGGTYDIGFQALSGMLERQHNVLYVCFDNEAYMNTGIQRSSSTPHSATTTTSPAGKERMGKRHLKKDLLSIIAAHHIPYAGSASVAFPADLQRKVRYAMGIEGPTFLVVHSPCPLGWKHASALTIEVARRAVECGLFPIVEIERGAVTNVMPIRQVRAVTDYLSLQGRFAHLMDDADQRAEKERAHLQALADYNIQVFGLTGEGEDPVDTGGIAAVGRSGHPARRA